MTIGNKNKVDARLEMTHELTQENRFTRSHFSRDEHETLLAFNSVNKRRQALEVERMAIKKSRVGRYAEGRFSKPKMTLKHGFVFLRAGEFHHLLLLLLEGGHWILTNFTLFRVQLSGTRWKFLRNKLIVVTKMVRGGAICNFSI